jgi:hypothetical protein
VGFMFNLGNQIFIFWFPVEIVSFPLVNCVVYNP